jgi:ADP-ribose pyrophosphatase YjhB (NUDIX family)
VCATDRDVSRHEPSRERAEALLTRLRADYGAFDVVDKTWREAPADYDAFRERVDAGGGWGAGVWLTDDDGRVLLVRNEGEDGWGDPGGKVEPDESVEAAAVRETREEASVECELTGVNEVHLVEVRDETDPDRPGLVTPIVVFDGHYAGGDPRPRDGEIADVAWFASSPDAVLYDEVATRRYPASE